MVILAIINLHFFMKRRFAISRWIAIMTLALVSLMISCGKSGGGNNTPVDATLAVTLTPPAGSTQAPAPSSGTFSLNVKITSTLPSKGVTISVVATPDGSATAFFTKTETSTKASNDYTITSTPVGKVCLVTVTVTSLNTSSNTWTGSYRYSAK